MKVSAAASFYFVLAQALVSPLAIEVRPTTTTISLGERFRVAVELRGPAGTTYDFPKEIIDGSIELVQAQPPTADGAAIYNAQVFALGAQARIPEIEIQYTAPNGEKASAKSAPVLLNVVSSLDSKEENPAPADFAPPVAVLVSRAFWIAAVAASVLVLLGIVFLARRLRFPRKPGDPVVTPAVTPEEDAMSSLDRLAAAPASSDPRLFYIQLVQVLKQYLERRLEAPVLEMTSTETLGFVKNHPWTTPHAAAVRDLVTSADMVKFGGSSDTSNADRQVQLVRDLVARLDRLRRADLELKSREQDRRKTA
jgi:hypothetical protein